MKTNDPQTGLPAPWRRWGVYAAMLLIGLVGGRLIWGGATDSHAGHGHETDADGNMVWTCSMHPQIREDGPGKCPLCGMDLIPASSMASAGDGPDAGLVRLSAAEINLAGLRTSLVGGGAGTAAVDLTGRVAADERRKSVVTAHISGRVEQLAIDFTGRTVKAGDELARMYSPDVYTVQQELRQAYALRESQPALYEAARRKLSLWKIGDAQIDELAREGAATLTLPVYADQSGVVTSLMVRKGMYVERGEPLLEIDDLSRVWILLDAYEQDLSALRVGQAVTIRTDAAPGRTWKATVRFIDPMVDPETRTVRVRAEVDNADGSLKPDMLVRAQVEAGAASRSDAAVTIPATAVLWTGNRSVVYVKAGEDGDGTRFRLVDVTLGRRMGDMYEITDGLKSGDEVVTHAAFTLDSAAQLHGLESMMSERSAKPATDPALQAALLRAVEPYLSLKDALVASDDPGARAAAEELAKTWENVAFSPSESAEAAMWTQLRDQMHAAAQATAQAADLATRRSAFQTLSNAAIALLDRYGVAGGVLYKQYCPMADSNRGAYWISKESQIRNPYYGSSMLSCGEVRGTWP